MTPSEAGGQEMVAACVMCGRGFRVWDLSVTPRGYLCAGCEPKWTAAVKELCGVARTFRAELVADMEDRSSGTTSLRAVKRRLAREITDALVIVQGPNTPSDQDQKPSPRWE